MNAATVINADRADHTMTLANVLRHVELVEHVLHKVMKDGVHYGASPGDTKKNLLKPGADKLCLAFQLAPSFDVDERDLGGDHREYRVTCRLTTMGGRVMGEGLGTCCTKEPKYRWRNSARKCPTCGKETIIKGKEEFGGGWLCFAKKGGCGAKWENGAKAIEAQDGGKVENPDIADVYNTCLKIGKKRAYVDATITATAASDLFTQDLEDLGQQASAAEHQAEQRRPAPSAAQPTTDRHAKQEAPAQPPKAAPTSTPATKAATATGSTTEQKAPAAGMKGRRPHGPDVMSESTKVADIAKWYEVAIDIYGEKFAKVVWKAAKDYKERFDLLRALCLDAEAIEQRVGMAGAEDMIGAELRDVTWDTDGVHVIAGNLRSMASRIDQQQLAAANVGAQAAEDEPPF